jgi:hypothetical protein
LPVTVSSLHMNRCPPSLSLPNIRGRTPSMTVTPTLLAPKEQRIHA